MTDMNAIKRYYDDSMGARQQYLSEYYKGRNLPVDQRTAVSVAKAASHTNVHVDFFKEIIDLKVGFMGQKIKAQVNIEDDDLKATVEAELKVFDRTNDSEIKNSETVRKSSISGISHRLVYTEDGIFKIKNIDGWSVVYDYKESPLDPERAYYYYETIDLIGKTVKHVDVYDKTTVTYYEAKGIYTPAGGNSQSDTAAYTKVDTQEHNFTEVPIIPIQNNDQWASDCETTVELMDVYDEIISDTAAEVKAMRLAYLKVWGNIYTGLDSEGNPIDINKWLTQTSNMNFGDLEEGKKLGDAEFLEKNINDTVIENTLNRYRSEIYEKSGSLDLKELAATERVFSIKAQMLRLEATASVAERYFRAALYKQTRLWTYWMREYEGIQVEETDIDFNFQRVFPRDLQGEATTLATLSTIIGLEDALTELGWDNAKEISNRADEASEIKFEKDLELLEKQTPEEDMEDDTE